MSVNVIGSLPLSFCIAMNKRPPNKLPKIKTLSHNIPRATELDAGTKSRLNNAASATSLTPMPPKLIGSNADSFASGQIKNQSTTGISIPQNLAR